MSNKKFTPKLNTISKDPLIGEAFSIAESIYDLLPQLPTDERWETAGKLRQASNSLLFNIAKAVADSSPTGGEYDWSNARKEAAGLLTMYRFADKRGFIEKDASLVLKIDQIIKSIDKEVLDAHKRAEAYYKHELAVWEDKYDMWQKLNKEMAK